MGPIIKSGGCDKDELMKSLKAYTPNGYKNLSFMSFGDASSKMHQIRPGTVIAVINPRLMPKRGDSEHSNSFCIESEAQVMLIGYSEDYNVCNARTANTRPGSLESFQCR